MRSLKLFCSERGVRSNATPDLHSPTNITLLNPGLAIFQVLKAGFVFSGKAGSGLVIARLPDGSWSAPSCIATGGLGWGLQIGADITDFVIVLNSEDAVRAFSLGGNVTIGGNIAATAGPIGTGGSVQASLAHPAPMFSYSKSKGTSRVLRMHSFCSELMKLRQIELWMVQVSLRVSHSRVRSSSNARTPTATSTVLLSPLATSLVVVCPHPKLPHACMRSSKLRRASMSLGCPSMDTFLEHQGRSMRRARIARWCSTPTSINGCVCEVGKGRWKGGIFVFHV